MGIYKKIACFKSYDVRGKVPGELDADLAFRIGRAVSSHLDEGPVIVGYDIRLSSPLLAAALVDGLVAGGREVVVIGQCGTEEVYFATADQHAAGGVMITASHNPADYNGMKFVGRGARPIGSDTGLHSIEQLAVENVFPVREKGRVRQADLRSAYIEHILGYIDTGRLKPLKVVANGGNGCAGPVLDVLEKLLPLDFIKLQCEPDGSFPNGVPNPLLPQNREMTATQVVAHRADFGVAWDGDFDRCFLFDEQGHFIEGYYLVALLAQALLERAAPDTAIVHDPRLVWNTVETVTRAGGVPVMSRTGHAYMKEKMRQVNGLYGGEMSGHHYFRDFAYCDSGMIPWLLVCELLNRENRPLSQLVSEMQQAFPVSGEINRRVRDPDKVIEEIEAFYSEAGGVPDYLDGLSIAFQDFRFNVRKSNTEPLLRLNVESRGKPALMKEKTRELLGLIDGV